MISHSKMLEGVTRDVQFYPIDSDYWAIKVQ